METDQKEILLRLAGRLGDKAPMEAALRFGEDTERLLKILSDIEPYGFLFGVFLKGRVKDHFETNRVSLIQHLSRLSEETQDTRKLREGIRAYLESKRQDFEAEAWRELLDIIHGSTPRRRRRRRQRSMWDHYWSKGV